MPYNPFDKPIGEKLTADDFQQLIEHNVAEGYHVEYKSDFPSNEKVGRSIASLANSYGGWYIVGVKTDDQHVAREICGFSLETYPDSASKVRDIVKSHLDPVPVFYPQVVGLEKGMSVLVVYIPSGQETPFISKDGRIYRRTHDASDPVPETSRHTLDRLVDNGRNVRKRFDEFCRDERTFSQSEEENGWVKIFLSPYPLGTIEKLEIISLDGMNNLLQISQKQIPILTHDPSNFQANLPFNSVQPTYRSVILRQIEPARAAFNSLAAEFFVDGRAKFFIPLRYCKLLEINQSESSQVKNALMKTRCKDIDSYLRFFDIGYLWLVVACLLSFYQQWIKDPWITDLHVALRGEGIWRSVPFSDIDAWGTHVQKYGLPVTTSDEFRTPEDVGGGLLMSLDGDRFLLDSICGNIGLAFGLPQELYRSILHQAIEKRTKKNI